MTYPNYLREKARRMRLEQRLSLDEIVERLAVPRTTVFYWIKDIPLQRPRSDYATPARERAWAAQSERYRLKREAAYARGVAEYRELAARPTFLDFVVLYIAEGSKRSRNNVAICNSDPAVMQVSARVVTRAHRSTLPVLDPIPRRSGSRGAPAVLERNALVRACATQDTAEVEQQSACRADLAIGARCAHHCCRGHHAARASAGMDRSDEGALAVDSPRFRGA